MQTFPTLDVVSVATGFLVSNDGVGGIYRVLNFMLDDELMTHQLPGAADAAAPSIKAQHPWLADVVMPNGDTPAMRVLCAQIVAEHGETLDLVPAIGAGWATYNAVSDLQQIADGRPVVAVHL